MLDANQELVEPVAKSGGAIPVDTSPESRLSMISRVSGQLAKSLDFEQTLQDLVDHATDLLGVERGAIMLLDPSGETLTISAAKGIQDELVRSTSVHVGFGIAGTVAQTGEALILENSRSEAGAASARQGHTGLCVPVAIHGKVLGVMNFENKRTATRFQQSDLEFATLIASQAAITLYCGLLHEEFQEDLAQEQLAGVEVNHPQRHLEAA